MAQARKHRLVARAPRKPSLLCSGAFLGVLLRAGQRPQQGGRRVSCAQPPALSGERAGRDQDHREWL